jgi:hypothetical protein
MIYEIRYLLAAISLLVAISLLSITFSHPSYAGKRSAGNVQRELRQEELLEYQKKYLDMQTQMKNDLEQRYKRKKELENILQGLPRHNKRKKSSIGVECEGLSLEQILTENCN